jgi:hypothetical protein
VVAFSEYQELALMTNRAGLSSLVVDSVSTRAHCGSMGNRLRFQSSNKGGPMPAFVQLGANQRLSMTGNEWPITPTTMDAKRVTAWLRRQILFEGEPLESVAAEFKKLEISGVFTSEKGSALQNPFHVLPDLMGTVSSNHLAFQLLQVTRSRTRRRSP